MMSEMPVVSASRATAAPGVTDPFRPCAVIPVYNHEQPLPAVVARLRAAGLYSILVDDGSSAGCAAVIDQLAQQTGVTRIRLATNQGKGAAVTAGLRQAGALGFTHALQVDADGQHDLDVIPTFIAAARAQPLALICGRPQYDASMPAGRRYSRYLTHIWVWINTLSLAIPDAMCGFRVYPVGPTLVLLAERRLKPRMAFDVEILVRLAWRDQPMRWLPVSVHYPVDGRSHFRLLEDNWQISRMHTRLFFGMLIRLPVLLWRRLQRGMA